MNLCSFVDSHAGVDDETYVIMTYVGESIDILRRYLEHKSGRGAGGSYVIFEAGSIHNDGGLEIISRCVCVCVCVQVGVGRARARACVCVCFTAVISR